MVFCFPLDRWVAGWWLSVVGCCWAVFGVGWWWCGSGVTPLPEYLPAKWKTLKATTSSQMGKTGDTLKSIFNVDVSPPHRPLYDPHFSEAFSSLCTISPSCLLFIHVSVCSRLSLTFDVPDPSSPFPTPAPAPQSTIPPTKWAFPPLVWHDVR